MDLLKDPSTFVYIGLAILSAYTLTSAARRVAPRIGLVDHPDGCRKLHRQTTPLMGGVAVYLSLLLTLVAARGLESIWQRGIEQSQPATLALLASAGLFCMVGVWDDRFGMRARTKLLWQIAASLPYALSGPTIKSIEVLSIDAHWGVLGIAFSVFWLVACVNIVNLLDGLDGLAGTMGLVMTGAIVVLSLAAGLTGIATLSLIFAGSLLGFLYHNWPPAKIFLGDAGSMMIGFVVGALAMESSMRTATSLGMTPPIVLFAVPAFDTLMAILRRKLTGKKISEADRGHIHHRLQDNGLTTWQTLLAIIAMCSVTAVAAISSVILPSELIGWGICVTLFAVVIGRRIFGYEETVLVLRRIRAIAAPLCIASQNAFPTPDPASVPESDTTTCGDRLASTEAPPVISLSNGERRRERRQAAKLREASVKAA